MFCWWYLLWEWKGAFIHVRPCCGWQECMMSDSTNVNLHYKLQCAVREVCFTLSDLRNTTYLILNYAVTQLLLSVQTVCVLWINKRQMITSWEGKGKHFREIKIGWQPVSIFLEVYMETEKRPISTSVYGVLYFDSVFIRVCVIHNIISSGRRQKDEREHCIIIIFFLVNHRCVYWAWWLLIRVILLKSIFCLFFLPCTLILYKLLLFLWLLALLYPFLL